MTVVCSGRCEGLVLLRSVMGWFEVCPPLFKEGHVMQFGKLVIKGHPVLDRGRHRNLARFQQRWRGGRGASCKLVLSILNESDPDLPSLMLYDFGLIGDPGRTLTLLSCKRGAGRKRGPSKHHVTSWQSGVWSVVTLHEHGPGADI